LLLKPLGERLLSRADLCPEARTDIFPLLLASSPVQEKAQGTRTGHGTPAALALREVERDRSTWTGPAPHGRPPYHGVGAAQQADHQQEDPAARVDAGTPRPILRRPRRVPHRPRAASPSQTSALSTLGPNTHGAGPGGDWGQLPPRGLGVKRRVGWEGPTAGVEASLVRGRGGSPRHEGIKSTPGATFVAPCFL
jgi:hypothetical protein